MAADGHSQPAGSLPNCIVIFTDDLGYGDLGCSIWQISPGATSAMGKNSRERMSGRPERYNEDGWAT
jgi:arylsulfatase A-like enzyme